MKYNELKRKLQRAGCYRLEGEEISGHPVWYSPVTGKIFPMSHHGSEEVKKGTLNSILKASGLK